MKRFLLHLNAFGICLLFFIFPAQAQVFMRPVDNAAALAIGGATAAYPGLGAGLANEAALGLGEKLGVYLSSALPYSLPDWQTVQCQGFIQLSKNDGLGLDVEHSGIEAYNEQRFRLLYGRRLGDKFLLGGSADVLRVWAGEYGSATAVSFNLGLLAHPLPEVWIAARVQNPVQIELAGAVIPTVLRIGAGWQASPMFLMVAETEKDLERPAQVKVGFEYRPLPMLILRAGVRANPGRPCFGAGLQLKNGLRLDAGAEWHTTLGVTPALMLTWRREN